MQKAPVPKSSGGPGSCGGLRWRSRLASPGYTIPPKRSVKPMSAVSVIGDAPKPGRGRAEGIA